MGKLNEIQQQSTQSYGSNSFTTKIEENTVVFDSAKDSFTFNDPVDVPELTINGQEVVPGEQVQADWNQNDSTAKDYIKNKPTIGANYVKFKNAASTDESEPSTYMYYHNDAMTTITIATDLEKADAMNEYSGEFHIADGSTSVTFTLKNGKNIILIDGSEDPDSLDSSYVYVYSIIGNSAMTGYYTIIKKLLV